MVSKVFLMRLAEVSQAARTHPDPAAAVSILSQLLLDVSVELAPLSDRYGFLLAASPMPKRLDLALDAALIDLSKSAALETSA